MTADRDDGSRPPEEADEDGDGESSPETPSWAEATAEMTPEALGRSRETAELSRAELVDLEDTLPAEGEAQVSVEDVAEAATVAGEGEAGGPWDPDETGELSLSALTDDGGFSEQPTQLMDRRGEVKKATGESARRRGPPPAPADADIPPPPTLDLPEDPTGGQWQAVRRSVRRPRAKRVSAAAIEQAIRVADVDSRPLQKSQRPGQVDPWDSFTPGAGLEGRIAMEVLGNVRRGTQRTDEVVGAAHFGPIFWIGAGVVAALMVSAAVLLYRTQSDVAPGPVEVVEPGGDGIVDTTGTDTTVLDEPVKPADRRELRSHMFAAFREQRFTDAVDIGERLESEFYLDWEAEFILAEAARLSRFYDDAVRRYAEFIRKYPKNVRNDDAHFWMAEAMRLQGNLKGARRHYQAVVDNRRSNLRKAAKKRLAQMK